MIGLPARRAAGLAAILALTACSLPAAARPTATPAPEPPQPAAPTYVAQRGLVIRQVQLGARVQPREAQQLAFDIDGRVRIVNARAGEPVKAGDVLAELDLTDIKTQIQQETIKFRAAQTVLSDTLQSYTRTVRLAELDLDQARTRLAMAQSRNIRANADLIASDLARNAKLIDDIKTSIANARAIGNQAGADNAQRQLTNAEVERERLTASYQNALAEAGARDLEIGLLRNEVERAQINLDTRISKVDPGLIQAVETSRLTLQALRAKEDRGTLRSAIDGVVTSLRISVGDNIRALDTAMVVAKPGELEIVAELSDSQLRDVALGLPVVVYLSSNPNRGLKGSIRYVPVLSVGNKDRLVRISLDEAAPMESGMSARCETILGRRENVIWLPPQAIRAFRGRQFVVIVEPGGTQRRADVITGLESEERVEIVDGVKEGEVILGQ